MFDETGQARSWRRTSGPRGDDETVRGTHATDGRRRSRMRRSSLSCSSSVEGQGLPSYAAH